MTNRELFNQYIRNCLERQIHYFEGLSDEQLAENEGGIKLDVHKELCFFKIDHTRTDIGEKADVVKWLGERSRQYKEIQADE